MAMCENSQAISDLNSVAQVAEPAVKRKVQLAFEQAQIELQQKHERHERARQIAEEEKLLELQQTDRSFEGTDGEKSN